MPTTVKKPTLSDHWGPNALWYLKSKDLDLRQLSKDTGFDFIVQKFASVFTLTMVAPPQRQVVYYKPGKAHQAHHAKSEPYSIPLPWLMYHLQVLPSTTYAFRFQAVTMSRTKPNAKTPFHQIRKFPDPNLHCLGPGVWHTAQVEGLISELIPRYWANGFNNDNGCMLPWYVKLAADRRGLTYTDLYKACGPEVPKIVTDGFKQWESLTWKQLQRDKQLFEDHTELGMWSNARFPAYDLTL